MNLDWFSHCNILTSDPAGLSDEKCTCVNNRCIRAKISGDQGITLNVDVLNWVQMWRSQEVGGRQIIIYPRRREVHISWREDAGMRTMSQQRLGPQPPPRLSSPEERERNATMARRVGVNMLQFCSVSKSPLTGNIFRNPFEPFQIKWEVYLSKELCPLVSVIASLCFCMHVYVYVLCGYKTFPYPCYYCSIYLCIVCAVSGRVISFSLVF